MAWRASRPFTLNGRRYAVGDPIADEELPTAIREKLKRYRRISDDVEAPVATASVTKARDATRTPLIKKLGYGWYTVAGVDGKFHGEKAALAAAGVAA